MLELHFQAKLYLIPARANTHTSPTQIDEGIAHQVMTTDLQTSRIHVSFNFLSKSSRKSTDEVDDRIEISK